MPLLPVSVINDTTSNALHKQNKKHLFYFLHLHFGKIPFGPPHLGIKITSQTSDSTLLLFTLLLSTKCNTAHIREKLIQLETLSDKKRLHRVLLFLRKTRFVQV